jgi:hypothetical protein
LKVKKANFLSVASQFASMSLDVVVRVSQCVANGDSAALKDEEEQNFFNLLKQVNAIAASIPESSVARVTRNSGTYD